MAPGKNTCMQGSHSWGRSPVGVQVVIRSLQVFLKALSTATVTLKRRGESACRLSSHKPFSVMLGAKLSQEIRLPALEVSGCFWGPR